LQGIQIRKFFQNLRKLYVTEPTTVNPPNALERSASLVYPAAVVVFSGLLDCGHPAVRSWFALKALDTNGQGWVDINIPKFSDWIGCACSTIYRHLPDKKFFHRIVRVGGKVRVYLRAIAKVAVDFGLDVKGLGACTEFDPKWLGKHSLSVLYGTELEAQNGQRQAYKTAIHSTRGLKRSKIINPAKAVVIKSKREQVLTRERDRRRKEAGRSAVSPGFQARAFRFFRIAHDQSVPGVTQSEIASRLGRCDRTIRRRLSNATRIRCGLRPLNRRRVLQTLPPDVQKRYSDYLNHIHSDFASVQYGDRIIQIGRIKIGEEEPRVYRLLSNIYEFDFPLLSARRARARLKRLVKRIEEQCTALNGLKH
jgi:predicted transcriptional regulator